jgi:hypothetical protein
MNMKGYTLLFTVLVVSIILAITLGISRISYTEIALSSVSREGAIAFFAADTGYECALYHDLSTNPFVFPASQQFTCLAGGVGTIYDATSQIHEFFLEVTPNSCAQVFVEKDFEHPDTGDSLTRVQSLGYNRSCPEVTSGNVITDPTVVQRAVEIYYLNQGGNSN